jgi:chemotaxis signal transduction protein
MFANTISNKWSETTAKNEPTIELVVFDIGEVSFGIPIYKIDRIISNVHPDENPTLTQNFEIIDLHERLTGIPISNPTAIAIFTNATQQLCGIPIDTVPTLICVPLDRIRTLPSDFRTTNPLGIASHIAMVSTPTELTIFILA